LDIPVTDKINSWIFHELTVKISVHVNQSLKVTFNGVAVTQSRVTVLNLTKWLFHRKKMKLEKKSKLHYIHPCTIYVGFTVRVGAKLRC